LEATVGVAGFNSPLVQLSRPLRQFERMFNVVVEDEDDEDAFAEFRRITVVEEKASKK
jgi:hypothetical protein